MPNTDAIRTAAAAQVAITTIRKIAGASITPDADPLGLVALVAGQFPDPGITDRQAAAAAAVALGWVLDLFDMIEGEAPDLYASLIGAQVAALDLADGLADFPTPPGF